MALTSVVGDHHRPFLVRATLRTGIGMDLPYGLDLAGMLGARMRVLDREALMGTRQTHQRGVLPHSMEEVAEDMALPLAQCHTGFDWHWLASCAIPLDPDPDPESRVFYRVVDSGLMQSAATRPLPYHHPSKGSFRTLMVPAPVIVCREVEWRGVGDVAEVRRLLSPLTNVGRRRNTGEGRVREWAVHEIDVKDPVAWVHAEGTTVLRPVPAECLDALRVPHSPVRYAIRPPSWNPERLHELAGTADDEDDWGDTW